MFHVKRNIMLLHVQQLLTYNQLLAFS